MIDAMARVDPDCLIGEGTRVWQFASVIRAARIGRDCNIGSCAIVDGASVGDKSTMGAGSQVHPGIHIGKEVFVGPGAIFCNDPWPRVRKGDFDIDAIMRGLVVTLVDDRASIGAGAIVLPGRRIGSDAMVAAGAVVDRDIQPMHLLKRSGAIVLIERRQNSRMRQAA